MKIEKICIECGKTFECDSFPSKRERKLCSLSCTSIYGNKNRKGYRDITLSCAECGKEFVRRKGDIHKKSIKHFCSKICSSNHKKGDKRNNTSISLKKAYSSGKTKPTCRKYRNGGYRDDLKIYVRSNWEANFARILTFQGKTWVYEPMVFTLLNGSTYRPDFYLPEENKFVEVKGYWIGKAKEKYTEFSKSHNTVLIDEKKYNILREKYKNTVLWEGV